MKRHQPLDPSPAASQPAGYVRLARRLTAWTSNLLASAIVLVLALGGGQQLVSWYREDALPVSALSDAAATWSDGEPLGLELVSGGSVLRRERVSGDIDAATVRLERFCRFVLDAAPPATSSASESEQRFLATLQSRQARLQVAGRWRIYLLDGIMPIVVGVREAPPTAGDSLAPLAEPLGRVLAWGVAVRSGQNDWVLYQHQVLSDGVVLAPADLPIPLPADARRTLTITGRGGERTVGLAGSGVATSWQRHFDQHFRLQGWHPRGWQSANAGWHAQYEHEGQIAEVHFVSDRPNELLGLLIIGPGRDET